MWALDEHNATRLKRRLQLRQLVLSIDERPRVLDRTVKWKWISKSLTRHYGRIIHR